MFRCDRRSTLPVLALLCFLDEGTAQTVRVFDAQSGLPHNRINRIYRDSKNFLWICTDGGLSRFDGHQFVSYTTADGVPHNYVNAVLETRSGDYWMASDGGISRFDPRPRQTRFTTYAPAGRREARHVNALLEEPDGSLLLGTSAGLYRFQPLNPGSFEHIDIDRLEDAQNALRVHAIARDTRGSVWLATDSGLYQRGRGPGWTHYRVENYLGAAFVTSFADDRDGRLWVTSTRGIGRIATDPAPGASALDFTQTNQPGLGREVRGLWFGTDGRRWIATNTGLKEWLVDSNAVSRFRDQTIQDGFPHEAVISMREDSAGHLWIGTRRSGLVHMGSSRFQTFSAAEGSQFGRDQILLEVGPGQVSVFDVGGKRNRLYRQDRRQRFVPVLPALPERAADTPQALQMSMQDHTGAWWFSTSLGLFRFPVLGGPFDLRLLPECAVDRFFEDSSGDLWISSWCGGVKGGKLARWARHSGVIHDESHRLPPDARTGIASFVQDHAGTMWIGMQVPGRLLRLREGRFQPISADWRGHINRFFVDSKGRLWITSTQGGLALIDDTESADPQLRRYTRAQGLSADEVWCVTEDRQRRIYAGTSKGVDRLDPDTGQIVHYSAADGLVRGDIRSALCDRNGDLWFASAHGVSKFTPGADRAVPPSRARITGLRTAGVPLPLSELGETEIGPVRFASHQNSLQIDFAATEFRFMAPLRYQFRLDREGQADRNPAWQDLGTSSTVHFVNLGAGDFAFHVRALTPDGLPGEQASLTFAILQPFWRAWWFQLMCALSIAAIAWWMHIRRLRQHLAIERVRSHIAMDLHDDIGAGLARISVIGESLKSRIQAGDHEVQGMLDDIAGSSRQLITEMGDIVWSLDPRRDQIEELANRLRAFGSDLLERRGVEWTVDAPLEKIRKNIPPVLRRQLYLVFKEGIHNIAKHSHAKKAHLRLWFQDGQIWGALTDDGQGTSPGSQYGTGIPSMRERVKQLAGHFEMSAPAGGGTSIHVRVPLPKPA